MGKNLAKFRDNTICCACAVGNYPDILDIETTHSTWHEPLQTMSAVVLRVDGVLAGAELWWVRIR